MDIRTYVVLEQRLLRQLRKSWLKLSAPLFGEILDLMKSGDFVAATEMASSLSLAEVGTQNEQYIRYLLKACCMFGAGSISAVPGVLIDPRTAPHIDNAVSTMLQYLKLGATLDAQKNLVQLIAQVREGQVVLKAERKVREFVSFSASGDEQLQLISSLHSSRLSVWGFVAEAELVGVSRYRLDAVLDGRTSDFCRLIHGKTFSVADARTKIDQVLSAQDPNDLKTIQPWPKQDKKSIEAYAAMSEAELVSAGLHIPPFHPKCRTLCSLVGKVSRLEKPSVTQPPIGHKFSTAEQFKKVGVTLTDKQVDHWNAYVGVEPAEWLSKLSGATPLDALEGVFGKNSIKISSNGDILTKVKGLSKGLKYSSGSVLDPFSGTMYLDHLEFLSGDPTAEASFVKTVLSGLVDAGKSVGAKSVAVAVGDSAYAFSKMGFLPDPAKWQEIRLGLIDDLTEGPLIKVFDSLDGDQKALLLNLLSNPDEKALGILADLTWTYRGKYVGELLLENVSGVFGLNLSSEFQTGKYFGGQQ